MQPDTGGSRSMIITTTENIPEARVVKTLGQVFGLTVPFPQPRRQHRRMAEGPGRRRDPFLRQAERGRSAASDRPDGGERRLDGSECGDDDALRLDRDGPEQSEIVAYGTARIVEWEDGS